MKTTKLADSIYDLPDLYEQESLTGATDEDWKHLCDGTGQDFMPYNVASWEYGEDGQDIIVMEDGSVHVESTVIDMQDCVDEFSCDDAFMYDDGWLSYHEKIS